MRLTRHLTPAVLLASLIWLPAGAEDTPEDGGADERSEQPELICRYEKVTGSHRHRRICMTAQEMEAKREADQERLRSFQGNRGGRSNTESGL